MSKEALVIGAGAWGTALARLLALQGRGVGLWCREPEIAVEIAAVRENRTFLPGVGIPEAVRPFTDPSAGAGARFVILAVPAQHIRKTVTMFKPYLDEESTLINVAKGIEIGTALMPSQIIRSVLGRERKIHTLSGPTHAEEVGRDMPSAAVVAGRRVRGNRRIQQYLNGETFRVYTSTDQIGVEIAGALKNVIALAAGIAQALGCGANTVAALATRGLSEITHLGEALGADPRTFSGLAGMGDLFVTLASEHSRNLWAGREIGRGRTALEVQASTSKVIEGIPTCCAAITLAERYKMEMPIVEQMGAVLFGGLDPRQAVAFLMRREPIAERVAWYMRWRGRHDKVSKTGPLASVRRRYRRYLTRKKTT